MGKTRRLNFNWKNKGCYRISPPTNSNLTRKNYFKQSFNVSGAKNI